MSTKAAQYLLTQLKQDMLDNVAHYISHIIGQSLVAM